MKNKLLLLLTLMTIHLSPMTAHGFILVSIFDAADQFVTWTKILKSKDPVTGEIKYHTPKLGLGHKFWDWPIFPFTKNFWQLADKLELKRTFIIAFPLVVFFEKNETGFEESDSDGGALVTNNPLLEAHPAVAKALAAVIVDRMKNSPTDEQTRPVTLTEEEVAPLVNAMVTVPAEERQALIEKLIKVTPAASDGAE